MGVHSVFAPLFFPPSFSSSYIPSSFHFLLLSLLLPSLLHPILLLFLTSCFLSFIIPFTDHIVRSEWFCPLPSCCVWFCGVGQSGGNTGGAAVPLHLGLGVQQVPAAGAEGQAGGRGSRGGVPLAGSHLQPAGLRPLPARL